MIQLKYIILCIIIIVLICHIRFYTKTHPSLTILQSTIDKVDFEMLNNKIPIIITDRVVNIQDVFTTIFNYQYTFINQINKSKSWEQNSSKFMIASPDTNQTIKIAHPKSNLRDGKYEYVDIVLQKNQILILPYGWWILTNNYPLFVLDDVFSKMISYIL